MKMGEPERKQKTKTRFEKRKEISKRGNRKGKKKKDPRLARQPLN